MDLELLDRLEDRVDVAVSTVNDLRMENELLKEETQGLESKVESLTRDLESAAGSQQVIEDLRKRCTDMEQKLDNVRSRIESMVGKMKVLEG
jgi:FtsZ-binding cell division protein ZapB